MDATNPDFWAKIGIATLCGFMVGLERQLRGKPAGIRTSIFICLGTCLFILLSSEHASPTADGTRVLGQVVTGVGFIGAGMIMTRGSSIVGLTSAAVVWVLAAIGAIVGFGHYAEAIVLAVMTVVLLAVIGYFEGKLSHLRRGVHSGDTQLH